LGRLPFRRIIKAALLLILIVAASLTFARLFSGKVRQSATSPDGKYVADCREFRDFSTVQIGPKFNPFRHTVVDLLYDAGLSVTWIDSKNLLIDCQKCGELYANVKKDSRWRDVSIYYTVH